jgi:regulatory protein
MIMVISGLRLSRRNHNRVDIYIDGKRDFSVMKSIADDLAVGQELSPNQIESLKKRDMEERTYQYALNLISRRQRSERELKERFQRRNTAPEIQEAVIERLREKGLVDDDAFALAWVENRQTFRPRSSWAIKQELRQKGVPDSAIQTALADFDDEHAAYRAASKAAGKYSGLSWELFKRRLSGYLRRRGFQYSTISPIVKRVWLETSGNRGESED